MVTLEVCVGSACHTKGSYTIISKLQELIAEQKLEEQVNIKAAFCFGKCSKAVSVKFEEEEEVYSVDAKSVEAFFSSEVLKRIPQ
ncbi:(2Fe-2S) ferredoxin domain-containing protein [Oscillospiraceae bacterium PP1C4]